MLDVAFEHSAIEVAGIATEEEAAEQYQRMLIELHADDFYALWHYVSMQGRKP